MEFKDSEVIKALKGKKLKEVLEFFDEMTLDVITPDFRYSCAPDGGNVEDLTQRLSWDNDKGSFVPVDSEFLKLFRNGGYVVIEDQKLASPEVSTVLMSAIYGYIKTPYSGMVDAHEDFVMVFQEED